MIRLNCCTASRLKQKFPSAFQDVCLYSEVCSLLANYTFRLTSRRFIQEMFMDVNFDQVKAHPVLRYPGISSLTLCCFLPKTHSDLSPAEKNEITDLVISFYDFLCHCSCMKRPGHCSALQKNWKLVLGRQRQTDDWNESWSQLHDMTAALH